MPFSMKPKRFPSFPCQSNFPLADVNITSTIFHKLHNDFSDNLNKFSTTDGDDDGSQHVPFLSPVVRENCFSLFLVKVSRDEWEKCFIQIKTEKLSLSTSQRWQNFVVHIGCNLFQDILIPVPVSNTLTPMFSSLFRWWSRVFLL